MGRGGKASKPCSLPPTWTLQPSTGSHVGACSEHLLCCMTACLEWFWLPFHIYIYINLCAMFCCSYLLCNVFLYWEKEQRWLQLFISGEGVWIQAPAAWGGHCCLPEGFQGSVLQAEVIFFLCFSVALPFYFNC